MTGGKTHKPQVRQGASHADHSNRDHQATAPTGEPVLRVHFFGEGGESVTVDMANLEAWNNEVVLDRARAILVQTATFNDAVNDYDAQSNGNFDDNARASAGDGEIYVFEYREGEQVRRVSAKMPSFEAARGEALRSAVDLLIDLQPSVDAGWLVRVRDSEGALLCAIDVQEAEAARRTTA